MYYLLYLYDVVYLSYWGDCMWPRPKKGKPEESKTVRQWALLGRIPIEGARPSYIWEAENRAQTIYFHLRDTREMTEEEEAVFLADTKG